MFDASKMQQYYNTNVYLPDGLKGIIQYITDKPTYIDVYTHSQSCYQLNILGVSVKQLIRIFYNNNIYQIFFLTTIPAVQYIQVTKFGSKSSGDSHKLYLEQLVLIRCFIMLCLRKM